MSWISDVKTEISSLELSRKKLKSFGLLVGGFFLLISLWIFLTQNNDLPETRDYTLFWVFLMVGGILFIFGALFPLLLKTAYKIWMGLAFALGWIVSRILLTILFYLMVTPIALLARLVRKKFLDLEFKDDKDSYWIIKGSDAELNYRKMY